MIKSFISNLIFSAIIIAILLFTYYEGDFKTQNISDALFVVGIFMFFIGLISLTNARRIFTGFKYTFNVRFRKGYNKSKSYYDYSKENKKEDSRDFGFSVFVLGVTFISVSLYLALS